MWNWTTMSFSGGGARYSQMRPTPWPAPPGAMNVLLLGGRGAYENVAVMPEHDSFVDGQNEPGFTDEIPLDEEPHDDKDDQIPFFRSRRSMTSFTRTNSATSSRTSFGETDMVELFYDQDQHILVPPGEVRRKGLNGRLLFAVLASAVGSAFQHGYNLGVVNAPQAEIENFINQTAFIRSGEVKGLEMAEIKFIFSWATSIYCVGGMLGGSLVGYFADTFGRKGALLMNNVLVFIAALLFGFSKMAQSYEMIIVGRFFIGINSGFNAGLAPMYLTEVAPVHLRGAVGTVYQLVITISIMVSQIIGMKSVLGTADGWPILFALTACAGVLQLLTLPFCPDSPKYLLINKGQDEEAENALKWFRGTADIADEMQEVRKECDEEKLRNTASMREMIMNPVLRFPLLISLMMMVAQQFSGINCAIYYSTEIFKQAGFREQGAQYATLGMGAMNVAMTFVSLVLVERAGRKSLMIFGLVGMFVCTILLTICLAAKDDVSWLSYVAVVLVISFVVMFATGPGSIPWFIVNELFTQGARPLATSIAVATNWGANFFVGLAFLPISLALGPYVFLIFSGLLLFFAMFTYKYVPETKNRTIEEIQSMFRQRSYQ